MVLSVLYAKSDIAFIARRQVFMKTNILDYLETTESRFPGKTAVTDGKKSCSYTEVKENAQAIGTALSYMTSPQTPVGIFADKSADILCTFFGAVYAGCFYSVISPSLPQERIKKIYSVLAPAVIVAQDETKEDAERIFTNSKIVTPDELMCFKKDENRLEKIRNSSIDTNPLYLNFTSGSTGTPKGIAVSHRSVLDFIDCFCDIFNITDKDIVANQAPFDFDVSVKDIYSCLKTGATLDIIPRSLFSSPKELTDRLCEDKVTTMIWAVSALCLISTFHCLDYRTPDTVNKVLFSGEVMPYKHLKAWREHLSEAMFVNLYGPTEITCNCTYHILEKDRDYSQGIPIGKHFPNEDVILLDKDDKRVTESGVQGEICVRGSALALGYYNCPEQNSLHFVQNPLNPYYPETIYRTGDLARYDENGELVFAGRKDFQIKHMGHRIELEEVQRAMEAIDGVERCCCIFDAVKSKLKGFYTGTIDKKELHLKMEKTLPVFMIPGMLRQVDDMPLTKNGKIDRKALEEKAKAKI